MTEEERERFDLALDRAARMLARRLRRIADSPEAKTMPSTKWAMEQEVGDLVEEYVAVVVHPTPVATRPRPVRALPGPPDHLSPQESETYHSGRWVR